MSHWRVVLKIITAITALTAIVAGGYLFLTDQTFRVSHVEIELANNASHSFIFPRIKDSLDVRLKNVIGQFVWSVDLNRVMDIVEKDLRVKDAKVSRVLPDKIRVTVAPYTPVANVMGRKSDVVFPMARDGEMLPAIPTMEAPDSPILRGEEFLQNKVLRKQAIEILRNLAETGSLSLRSVSEIQFTKKNGFELTLHPSGMSVWLGSEDFGRRLRQSKRVVEYLYNQHLQGRVIDARFAKKVVVKLRNEP